MLKMKLFYRQMLIALVGALGLFAPSLYAEELYPSRPVTMVIPFPSGGFSDSIGRLIAPALERALKSSVIVVNRGGAGGAIGAAHVAKSEADGYTILFTLSSISTLPEQALVNNQKPVFLLNQLDPIARISADPMVFVVKSDSEFKTLGDLIAKAKAEPQKVTYASSGNYGTVHVPIEMFAHDAKIKLHHIPYRGGGPIMAAMLAGQIDFTMLPMSSISAHVQAGNLRMLAVVGKDSLPAFPSILTTSSYGLNFEYLAWTGIFAPSNVPADVMKKLRSAFQTAAADQGFQTSLQKVGGTLAYQDAPDFKRFWARDEAQLTEVVRRLGKLE
ncbi:MAG TPA: tripartite tricarboxylate transporter substrate binding protein [Eoetvoesiella sp.]